MVQSNYPTEYPKDTSQGFISVKRKNMKALVLLVLMVASLLGGPLSVHAAEASQTQFSGQFAHGYSASSESDCIATHVYVSAFDGRISYDPGQPAVDSFAYLSISRYNSCTGEWLGSLDAHGPLAADAFQVDRRLNTATLRTTLTAYDWSSGTEQLLNVNVSWTADGELIRSRSSWGYSSPGFRVNGHYVGSERPAGLAGTISNGSDLTLNLSGAGSIGSAKSGSVSISH